MNSRINSYIGTLATPIVAVVAAIVVYFIVTKGIKAWSFRNLGTTAGVDDYTNLATEFYREFDGWTNETSANALCEKILRLSDGELGALNNRFVRLYQSKCLGGGFTCADTTSMKTMMVSGLQTCIWSCDGYNALVARFDALGL